MKDRIVHRSRPAALPPLPTPRAYSQSEYDVPELCEFIEHLETGGTSTYIRGVLARLHGTPELDFAARWMRRMVAPDGAVREA